MCARIQKGHLLVGFGLSMGFAVPYLWLPILIPAAGLFLKRFSQSWTHGVLVVSKPDIIPLHIEIVCNDSEFFIAFATAALLAMLALARWSPRSRLNASAD